MLKPFSFAFTFCAGIGPAHAHLGHLDELAGHSHWLGLGAIFVAGSLGAILGKLKEGSDEEADDSEEVGELSGGAS